MGGKLHAVTASLYSLLYQGLNYMICTLYHTIYEHLQYVDTIRNFLNIIRYVW